MSREAKMKMEQLLPLKVYPFTLSYMFAFFTKGLNFCEFLFASLDDSALPKGI